MPYSDEFRDRETNEALLGTIAGLAPKGGEPGEVIPGTLAPGRVDELLAVNTFRHDLPKAISSHDIWPCCCCWRRACSSATFSSAA